MKRIILSLLFNVCVICPAFCVSSIQTACMQLGFEDCGNVPCSLPICITHEGVSNASPYCEINIDCKCVQKCTYTCEPGYYGGGPSLFGCTRCPEHATCPGASAVDRTATFTCDAGYEKNATKTGCVPTTAIMCPERQYRYGDYCAKCPVSLPNGAVCDNETFTCPAGYEKEDRGIDFGYICCRENATCDNGGTFTNCDTGYYGDATNGCTRCPDNATECDGAGAATKCEHSYLLYNGKCMWCPTAAICIGGDTMTCADGYICEINDDDNVVECYNCSDGADCTGCKFKSCKSGYYGSDETNCKICPDNAICSTTEIISCVNGYILESGACNECSVGEVCEDGKFSRCTDGYYGSDRGKCKVCPANATCNGGTTFQCYDKYYINETKTGCELCGDSRVCEEGKCKSCADNYYGKCKDGCFKCPSLNGRPGTSVAGENTDRSSCSVSVTSSSTLDDGVGKYYFEGGTCNATAL